jgi:hypothetical protein
LSDANFGDQLGDARRACEFRSLGSRKAANIDAGYDIMARAGRSFLEDRVIDADLVVGFSP